MINPQRLTKILSGTFSEHLNPGFLRLGNLPEILTGLLQVIGYRLELCFFSRSEDISDSSWRPQISG
ncbi:hypothetical protein [Succinimonas sp.]|uniref:hypothetical protein n=1 Tax=Succinimonas sp. TaxID=1936151 RepID=UPI003867296B